MQLRSLLSAFDNVVSYLQSPLLLVIRLYWGVSFATTGWAVVLNTLFGAKTIRQPRQPLLSTLRVLNEDLAVTRKSVRALRVTFSKEGQLRATAPWRMSDAVIVEFVESKAAWVLRQRARLVQWQAQLQREAAELEGLDPKALRALKRQQLRQLHADALALLPKWEGALGVKVSAIGIRAMRSRWGSCNTLTGKIWLSLNLVKHPPEALEYILVHEMVHLLVRPHNAKFKAHLDRHLPAWKQIHKKLNGRENLI